MSSENGAIHQSAATTQEEPVDFSQDAIAMFFANHFSSVFKYVRERAEWYHFEKTRWVKAADGRVLETIRVICRKFAASGTMLTESEKRKLCSAANVAGIERLACNDSKFSTSIERFDQNRMLLNTPDGIVDLTTGVLHENNPEFYITRITTVGPKEMETPIWDAFIQRVQPDPEIREYLMRRSGYMLTGQTGEQKLFFDHGRGANGKSKHQIALLGILGSYAATSSSDLITETKNDKHPEEIARLYDARVVGLSEPDAGRRWNQDRIKVMTGQDKLVARFMHQGSFEYRPEFKMLILGNDLPALRDVGEAISRRFEITEWPVKIPEAERDEQLSEKLVREYPGILCKWIQGCLEWQKQGLNQPSSVKKATKEYLSGEDKIGRWLEECTEVGDFATNDSLFTSWCDWCDSQKEMPGKKIGLGKKLEERGYARDVVKNQRGFKGLSIVGADREVAIAREVSPEAQLEASGKPPQERLDFSVMSAQALTDWEERP